MKSNFRILIILAGLLLCSINLSAQQITLNLSKTPLKVVLKAIEKQCDFTFVYSNSLNGINDEVTIKANKEQLENVLKTLLVAKNIGYKITEKQIALTPKELVPNETTVVQQTTEVKSQSRPVVKGVIKEGVKGEPVPFASIFIKENKSIGGYTDVNGSYSIMAENGNQTLVVSCIGYTTQEIAIGGRSAIDVFLAPEATNLDEVMIVAYGTAKKSTFTGSAAVVNEESFKMRPLTDITQALAATTPGVQIGTSNGQPGSEPTIRIRGIGSFNAGNAPLIILDGMPYDNAFSSINPSDIESVTVLKDASSASLYGARGANGVLLINTKKGKSGKPKVEVKYNFGVTSQQTADYKLLNDKEYMELYWETQRNTFVLNGYTEANANSLAGPAFLAGISYNPYLMDATQLFDSNGKLNPNAINHWKEDTDWYGAITQLGKRHDANISISGANENTDYYTSIGYMQEEGYVKGSQFSRLSAKANVNSKITKWLKVGTNLNISYSTSEGEQNESSGSNSNPFRFVRYIGNILPIHLHNPATGEYIYDVNGNKMYDFGNGWQSKDGTIVIPSRDAFAGNNHALEVQNNYSGYLRQTINIKGYADVSLAKGLKLTLNAGLGSNMYRSWSGGYVYEQKGNAGSSSKNTSNTTTWTFQQLFNYNKSFGKHNFDILAGHESYQYAYFYLSTSMKTQTIIGDNFEYANFTEVNALPSSYTNNYRVEGFLSRLNYDFDEKYFFSASYRRDGSSRFYEDVRWGDFWSVGAGWTLDKEKFMTGVKFVDMLKLRASYGVVGNDDLSSYYPWRATYAINNNGEPGYIQSSLGNRSLTWETSNNFDVATEFRLFNSRLEGSVEYFYRVSSDLLFSVPQPISSGISSIDINAGSMYNKGFEISLNGVAVSKNDFQVSINGNATFLKNKITDLPLDPYPTSVYKIEEGHSRYDFWLRQWYGVNPATGYNLFKADVDLFTFTDGELIEIDGVKYTENIAKSLYDYSGTSLPIVTGGIGAIIAWKNFSLKFNFYYQLGGQFYDNNYQSLMSGSNLYFAQHQDLLGRWRKPGDVTNIAKVVAGTAVNNIGSASSTRWLLSSNMIELTNLNLSYKIPSKFLQTKNITDATIYFSADNALMFSARRGVYPRRNFQSGYISNGDVYAPSRVISLGLSLTF
jgi:TonB-linked SusC/RagA family outer membrane protein